MRPEEAVWELNQWCRGADRHPAERQALAARRNELWRSWNSLLDFPTLRGPVDPEMQQEIETELCYVQAEESQAAHLRSETEYAWRWFERGNMDSVEAMTVEGMKGAA